MKPAAFEFLRPRDLSEAIDFLAAHHGEAKPLAGGQSLGPMLNLRLARPQALVDLRTLPELLQVEETAEALRIGACIPHAAIEDGALPDTTTGFLRHVAGLIAYRAVRNRGTIGGSLAHADPAADWIAALWAIEARLTLAGPTSRRELALPEFMLGGFTTALAPEEILLSVTVPRLSAQARWAYYKICRKTGEFAQAIGVVILDRGRARVVAAAIEAPPLVLEEAGQALLSAGSIAAATAAAEEIDRRLPERSAVARQLYRTAVRRALEQV